MTVLQAAKQRTPEYVAAEVVSDLDVNKFAAEFDDPYLGGARLHDGPDVFWATTAANGHPASALTRHALLQEAYLVPEGSCSENSDLVAPGVGRKLGPLEFDPQEHDKYGRNSNTFFTARAAREMDESVQGVCDELISELSDRGSCEFISEFAERLPSCLFLDLMGMPREKMSDVLDWERRVLREADRVKRVEAVMSVLKYLEGFVQEQTKRPTTALLRAMVTAQYHDERRVSDEELPGMRHLFYIDRLDTVHSVLGWIMRHLAGDQPLQERLRARPEDMPRAVWEFLRGFAVAAPARRARNDYVFNGVQIPAGDLVLPSTPAAGRDPRVYQNPHESDMDRNPRHVSLSTGPQLCLGMHLARRELGTALEAFLGR